MEGAPLIETAQAVLSGGAFSPNAKDFLDRVENPRMEKPFEPQALRTMVSALLRS